MQVMVRGTTTVVDIHCNIVSNIVTVRVYHNMQV